jgi:alkaline phosphatase D
MQKHFIFCLISVLIYSNLFSQQVDWVWSGAVTTGSAKVNARITAISSNVRLVVSKSQDLSSPLYSQAGAATDLNNRVAKLNISGLESNTAYYYAIEIGGSVDNAKIGKFKTHPEGPSNFKFAFASCAKTGSASSVFTDIKNSDPLFYMNIGDLHYQDIGTNDVGLYRNAFEAVLGSSTQSDLYQNVAFAYTWDDHDFGPNNSDSRNPGKPAAQLTYREYVPHYPLAAGDEGAAPIYQTFSVGRVFFILSDSRSEKINGSIWQGAEQLAWFKQQLVDSSQVYPLIVWVQSGPWIGGGPCGKDRYFCMVDERAEIADFIKSNGLEGHICMLSGDAHMIAMDDGTNSDYAAGGGADIPVFHAAPLDQGTSTKGGPYSEGTKTNVGQYGIMEVVDDGGSEITVNWTGMHLSNSVLSYSFTVPAAPSDPGIPSVSIASPSSGATFTSPADVTVDVDASDSDGSITRVELRVNGGDPMTDDSAPYSFDLTGLETGNYSLEARVYDNGGKTRNSTIDITVIPDQGNVAFAVNIGGSGFTSGEGLVYSADQNFSGGTTNSTGSVIAGTGDDALYQSERYGKSFSYIIPLANGDYQVILKFAEVHFGTAGSRVFNVSLEGNQVISNLDIFSKIGKDAAYDETHEVTVSDGQLNIDLSAVTNNAKISGILVSAAGGATISRLPGELSSTPSLISSQGALMLSLPESGKITLWISDVKGQRINLVNNQEMSRGTYKLQSGNLNPGTGVWIYQLKTGSGTSKGHVLITR